MTTWAEPDGRNSEPELCDGVMDVWFLGILAKERNREMLARLEDTLISFLKDDSNQRLEFPPKSAFQRKVFHRVALYYKLDHKILEVEGGSTGGMRSLVLIKTESSTTPKRRLCDIDLDIVRKRLDEKTDNGGMGLKGRDASVANPARERKANDDIGDGKVENGKPAVFLRRPRSDSSLYKGGAGRSCATGGSKLKSVSEAEYEQARARIFKKDSKVESSSNERPPRGPMGFDARVKVAMGPVQGTNGFGGRGRGMRPSSNSTVLPSLPSGARDERNLKNLAAESELQGNGEVSERQEQSSTDDNDMNDPDFDRRYIRWAGPQISIQPPQVTPSSHGLSYFNSQPFSSFSYHSPGSHNVHHAQQHSGPPHLPHHQTLPGMVSGRESESYGLVMSRGGWTPQASTDINHRPTPQFNLQTMTDFPSLAQAHEMSRKKG